MKPGDIVKHFQINQRNGFREYNSNVKLIEKVGTVPNFWKFQMVGGQDSGRIINGFVYDEDQEPQKPKLTVIRGGKEASDEFNRNYKHQGGMN